MNNALLQKIYDKKIIAIVRGVPSKDMPQVAQALLDGGVGMMEITFDHSQAGGIAETLASLELVKEKFGDRMDIGAGTVLTARDVERARERGAEYIISPNVDPEVIGKTKELGLISMPGALTPSEVVAAQKMGGDIIKLFPVDTLGTAYIKALRGPLPHIPLAAVGGVTPDNIVDFLKAGVCSAGIGGSLVSAARVERGEFAAITETARAFSAKLAAFAG